MPPKSIPTTESAARNSGLTPLTAWGFTSVKPPGRTASARRARPRLDAKSSAQHKLRLLVDPHPWEELAAAKEFNLSAGRRR